MRIIFMLLAFFLNGCSPFDNDTPKLYQSQLLALGTVVNISLWNVEKTLASQAVHAIDARLHEIHHNWHSWQPGRLTDINKALANGQSIELTTTEMSLLQQATQLATLSQHLFNPAIGRMIQRWGFHQDDPSGPPPTPADIQSLLHENPRMTDLNFSGHQLRSTNKTVQLDVGAFAKGYAIDEAIKVLHQLGIQHAIINAGGDLRVIGRRGDRAWRIGIRHPNQPGVIASVEIQGDESVFTSGNYERYYEFEGQRYHHIIDPRTGYPGHNTLAVTVIHPNAATADAAATALLIAGPQQWRHIARQMGIEQVMLIDKQLVVHMTPIMAQRIQLQQQLKTIIDKAA